MIYNWKPYFTLKDSVMDPSYDGPDMCYFFDRPDDEAPSSSSSNGGARTAASKSFAGHVAGGSGQKGEAASVLAMA